MERASSKGSYYNLIQKNVNKNPFPMPPQRMSMFSIRGIKEIILAEFKLEVQHMRS